MCRNFSLSPTAAIAVISDNLLDSFHLRAGAAVPCNTVCGVYRAIWREISNQISVSANKEHEKNEREEKSNMLMSSKEH
jgi:hypothetical protein